MAPKAFVAVVVALALAASAMAFNITKILDESSDFSTFNNLLSQTKLADEINRRQTITVLAVDNSAAGAVSSIPADIQKKALAVHVILDYYDTAKLGALKNKSTLMTTLFQSMGQATNLMGFINFTKRADGKMLFGSAEPGAPVNSEMLKVVASRPYNISVLQISSAIVPPSIGSLSKDGAAPPVPPKANSTSPAPATSRKAGAPAPSNFPDATAPSAEDPAPSEGADAPASGAPSDALAPASDAPTGNAPAAADAPSPSVKSSHGAADAPEASTGSRIVLGASAGMMGFLMLMV